MEKRTVLVTGVGGNVGQGVLRNIADLNYNIKIVGTNIEAFSAGNHLCDSTYLVPYAYSENYILEINKIVQKENVELIIPTTDYEIYYLAKNKELLNTKIAASNHSISKIYLDKYLTYLHFKKLNIPFAQSWLPSEYVSLEEEIIVKPREGRGSRGIHINPPNPKNFDDTNLIQKLYRGKEITTSFYVKKDGNLHGLFTMERELSNGATSKSKTTTEYDSELLYIINEMIKDEGLKGSINLQSIVTSSNQIMPFEVNCRISGTNSIRHNLGFQDVKYTLEEYLFDKEPSVIKTKKGIAVRLLYDVIYMDEVDENQLNNNKSNFKIY